MEARELLYFVAVAEGLHFGRAAQRLGIAQPSLSRATSRLERRLGAPLLERSSRTVSLTEAGAVLLREGRAALDALAAAERRTRRTALAADGRPAVVLVSKAGASRELLAKLLDAHAADVADLPGLPLPRWPGLDGTYPDGPGPQIRDNVQLLQLIALGRACAVLPESVRSHLGDDLATVTIVDAAPVTTVIAWPPHSRSRAVAGLVRAATRL